jgi:dolichol-phosphate mannosyltransferase
MIVQRFLVGLGMAQVALGTRVLARFLRTAHGRRLPTTAAQPAAGQRVAVLVPVLNEIDRLGPCLEGLLAQGPEVASILVVDGGSTDGTQALVREAMARDTRLRLIDATPVPPDWNGKAWGLNVGMDGADPALPWLLTLDADVRIAPPLVRSLLAHAAVEGVAALSVATRQQISTVGEGLLHPSMLTTLVYRFGLPGHASRARSRIQANGQCFLVRRQTLEQTGALSAARASRCEDVTIARCLAAHGVAVGFYEADDLAWVRMYDGWRATWQNWPRSLPLRDQYWRLGSVLGLAEVSLVQALPLPLLALLVAADARERRRPSRASARRGATLPVRQQPETGDRLASTAGSQSPGGAPNRGGRDARAPGRSPHPSATAAPSIIRGGRDARTPSAHAFRPGAHGSTAALLPRLMKLLRGAPNRGGRDACAPSVPARSHAVTPRQVAGVPGLKDAVFLGPNQAATPTHRLSTGSAGVSRNGAGNSSHSSPTDGLSTGNAGVSPAPSLPGHGLQAERPRRRLRLLIVVNLVLLMARLGVLQGTARAYRSRPWSYWLSPLCDLPVSVQLWRSLLQRRHTWRGRVLVPGVLV